MNPSTNYKPCLRQTQFSLRPAKQLTPHPDSAVFHEMFGQEIPFMYEMVFQPSLLPHHQSFQSTILMLMSSLLTLGCSCALVGSAPSVLGARQSTSSRHDPPGRPWRGRRHGSSIDCFRSTSGRTNCRDSGVAWSCYGIHWLRGRDGGSLLESLANVAIKATEVLLAELGPVQCSPLADLVGLTAVPQPPSNPVDGNAGELLNRGHAATLSCYRQCLVLSPLFCT